MAKKKAAPAAKRVKTTGNSRPKNKHRGPRVAQSPINVLRTYSIPDYRLEKPNFTLRQVRVGDEVLTHRGRFRPVVEVMRNDHAGDIYGIKLSNRYNRVTWMTGEHPVLIRNRDGGRSWRLYSTKAPSAAG